jgi:hypothetical protein
MNSDVEVGQMRVAALIEQNVVGFQISVDPFSDSNSRGE